MGIIHSLHSDCTTQSIAFYQTLSREGGVCVARLCTPTVVVTCFILVIQYVFITIVCSYCMLCLHMLQVHSLVLDKMVRLQILDNISIVKWAVAPENAEYLTT